MSAAAQMDAPPVTAVDAFTDPNLLGGSFGEDSREAWRAILSGAFAVPMDDERQQLFKDLAGGRKPPSQRVRELWAIAGRRSDKTHTAAGIAVYLAAIGAELDGTLAGLTAGERGVVLLLAVDRMQARVALSYVRGLLVDSPVLSSLVDRETAEGVILANGVSIEVATNSHRNVRGRTLLAAILDECAFYRDESSATPDVELYRALVPSLATTGGMLIGISSPYARRGLLFDKYRNHYGKHGDVLVVQAPTEKMNPTIDLRIIGEAYQADPIAAAAEWGAQFRSDVETFLGRDVIERCTRASPVELPYDRSNSYFGFVDAAGGGQDEYTIAIGHEHGKSVIVDCVRAQRGVPADITATYAALLKSYGVRTVTGDKYAGSWVADEFERNGIRYHAASKPKAELYLDLLPAVNSERVEFPPDEKLMVQASSLERKTRRGGRDSVDHPPGGHDDRANVVAGLVANATRTAGTSAETWELLAYD